MTDQATQHSTIAAPLDEIYAVLTDFDRYSEWARDIKDTEVVEGDVVSYRAAAMGRSTRVTLKYDFSGGPERLSWVLTEGDVLTQFDGYYELTPNAVNPSDTDVEYHLKVDLVIPLPGFVKRRAEQKLLKAALPELKARLEGQRS